jgi:sulfatase modifying factor 1
MNRWQLAAVFVAVSVFFNAGSAPGAVTDADNDPLTPPGHPGAILDSSTNLLWLDATETQNRSLADVQSELGVGGEFAGWQIATRAQIHQLFMNSDLAITMPGPGWILDGISQTQVQALVSIYGQTRTASTILGTFLWHANSLDDQAAYGSEAAAWRTTDNGYWAGDNGIAGWAGTANPEFGVALIRPAAVVMIDWVTVGGPGNVADNTGKGAVAYSYEIGRYEVNNAQYATFLNAVATTDTHGLYHASMGSDATFGGITRSGGNGSYRYAVKPGFHLKPVIDVMFWNTLRFANWLDNGQPTGMQDATTTEDGAYTLTSNGIADNRVVRNLGANIVLPSENEWYKAAFFDPSSAVYYEYPTGSDTQTNCVAPASDTGNSANCDHVLDALTEGGAFALSSSPSGSFDQAGNVTEWTESIPGFDTSRRVLLGGSWSFPPNLLSSGVSGTNFPYVATSGIGFRVASVPVDTIVVNSFADQPDISPGNGACDVEGSATCTLRAAIMEANALQPQQGVPLAIVLPAGLYTLALSGADEDAAATGDLDISADVMILGNGPDTTMIDGNAGDRVIDILSGAIVEIEGVTLRNGRVVDPASFTVGGGAVRNRGDLTLRDCRVTDSSVTAPAGGSFAGGIQNLGPLRIERCLINHNTSTASSGIWSVAPLSVFDSTISNNLASGGAAGGLFASAPLTTLVNSTISGNSSFSGGAVSLAGPGNTTVFRNVTITNNSSEGSGPGGIDIANSTALLANTIVASNSGGDCAVSTGGLVSEGHNLFGDLGSCASGTDPTDESGLDPLLGALAQGLGRTPVHIPREGSAAIDGGNPAGCRDALDAMIDTDQRGLPRPTDGDGDLLEVCDIGAVEVQVPEPTRLMLEIAAITSLLVLRRRAIR